MLDWRRKLKIQADINERSIAQFTLFEALVFAERAGIVLCTILFLSHENKDFLTILGAAFVMIYVFLLAPVYGIILYMTERGVYRWKKRQGRAPQSVDALKKLCRAVNLLWLLPMATASYYCFLLYYQIFDGLHLDLGIR